jgi:hypothetical protein
MADFFEIDLLKSESSKSGDAIAIRYELNGNQVVHVVDGGCSETGKSLVAHINKYYGYPSRIDHVVVTHPHRDHAAGLASVFDELEVGTLWMLRPWLYADQLIGRFSRFTSVERLKKRLRELYPDIAALEELALKKGVKIEAPFQGSQIGSFTVLAPSQSRFFDLVVESDKTPEAVASQASTTLAEVLAKLAAKAVNLVKAAWGVEVFPESGTSAENEMSVIQYANLQGESIVLTGDAGRGAMLEAADFAPLAGLALPGVDRFQVPHHGSRHNVSAEVLDRWLGAKLSARPTEGTETFTAAVSASQEDEDHPRKAVLRGVIHRGAKVHSNETGTLHMHNGAPARNWGAAARLLYPEDQEEA